MIFVFLRHIIPVFMAGILWASPWAWGAAAQRAELTYDDLLRGYSESEKVGFAFYRLTDTLPDFRDWITPTDEYKSAKPSLRPDIMQRGILRLQQGYLNFYLDQSPLRINTTATVRLEETAAGKAVHLHITAGSDPLYFPFNVGDLWIGMVVNGVQQKTSFPVTDAAYDRIKTLLRARDTGLTYPVRMEIVALAKDVDSTNPLVIDEIPLFPMLADPVVIALWKQDEDNLLLWEQVAPGYAASRRQDVSIMLDRE